MKVIITGDLGFVGGELRRALEDDGFETVGYDKKEEADISNLKWAGFMVDDKPDLIVHLAASCSTSGSIMRPEETFRDTVMTTVTVCNAAAKLKVPVLLTSSVKARDGMTPYGAAKRMSEMWAMEMSNTFGFPLIINRPGTIYGPGQEGSPESGWIAWFLKARDEGIKVTINGDGAQRRDLLHVFDYVGLLVAQIDDPRTYVGKIWDVGGGPRNTVTVEQIAKYLGLEYEFGPARYGDADSYIGVNDVPGWAPLLHWKEAKVFAR